MSQPPPQPPNYAPPAAPPRRRRIWPWVLLGAFLTVILLFAACTALVGGAAKSIGDADKTVHHVTYQVETSGPTATVIYDTSTPGGISNATATGVRSGWSIDVDQAGLQGPNLTASLDPNLSAAKQQPGTVTCKILSGGRVVKQASSTGEFASVSCNASVQELENH